VTGRLSDTLRPTIYPIRGERILLRPLTSRDTDALLAYRNRQDVCRYVPFEPMTRADVTDRLAAQWARTRLTAEGQSLTLGAQVKETDELAGDCTLFWHSREHAGAEIVV
jgi:RimJ/RimL family protein N-acetyltransferase